MKNFTTLLTTMLFASLFVTLFLLQLVQAENPPTTKILVQVRSNPGQPVENAACLVRNADGGTGWIGRTDYNGYVEFIVPDSVKSVIVSCYSTDGIYYGAVTEKLNENETTIIRIIIA